MEPIGRLTVQQAETRLEEMNRDAIAIRDRVKKARGRIHEFAPATQQYDITLLTLSLDEIDGEFSKACAATRDPHGMAARTGLTVEEVQELGNRVLPAPGTVLRMAVKREGVTAAYSIPFQAASIKLADKLMDAFYETLARHGWEMVERKYVAAPVEGDVVLAGV